MWKSINFKSLDYLLNFEFNYECYSLRALITNFENLWTAEFNEKLLVDTFKKLNPLIELEMETLIREIENLLNKNDTLWDIQITDLSLKLNLKSALGVVPFKFEINFSMVNNKMLFQIFVLPLLILVKGMQKHNEYLCNVIKKKDMEISEYKLDGAVLSRKTVETPAFDETSLSQIFHDHLNSVSCENMSCLLDGTISSQLDEIKTLLCNKPVENLSSVEKLNASVEEPPKKRFIENEKICEKIIENTSKSKKADIPIERKKTITVKRLHNL